MTRGIDPFGAEIVEEYDMDVENVLVGHPTSDDIVNNLELYGKRAVYTLGIPKGDQNDWENKRVTFFGETFRTFGYVTQGIDDLVPLEWNKKIMVERYG